MRLCSQVVRFTVAALFFVSSLGLVAGCYPHRGSANQVRPDQLLELAEDACERRDMEARQMLLSRLARRHPNTAEGRRARHILDAPDKASSDCSVASPSNQTRD